MNHVIDPEIRKTIESDLDRFEREENVEILHAVESGSRAWGFASTDSDYDVRFIYRHPAPWYLSVLPKRDVLEYPIDNLLDYSGWDLKKTLFLLNKSNPVLFEWLNSPIVYKKNDSFLDTMTEVSRGYFSPIATIYHYLHMAGNNYREYLKRDRVKIKKYFYVLRPILACAWIEKKKGPPPMEFDTLLNELLPSGPLREIVDELLVRKKSGVEMGEEEKIPELNNYIEKSVTRFEEMAASFDPAQKPDAEELNKAFREILGM